MLWNEKERKEECTDSVALTLWRRELRRGCVLLCVLYRRVARGKERDRDKKEEREGGREEERKQSAAYVLRGMKYLKGTSYTGHVDRWTRGLQGPRDRRNEDKLIPWNFGELKTNTLALPRIATYLRLFALSRSSPFLFPPFISLNRL